MGLVVMGVVLLVMGAASGCGQTSRRTIRVNEALTDPRSSERVAGVAAVGRGCERDRVPVLIDLLDDPDPAVRLTAGATLRELTGYDTGYRPWADVAERRAQMQAWRRWYVGQTPRPIPPPPLAEAVEPGSASPRPSSPRPPSSRQPSPRPPSVPQAPSPVPVAAGSGLPPPVIRVVRGPS